MHSLVETDYEILFLWSSDIFSGHYLSLSRTEEGQLCITGESICTELWLTTWYNKSKRVVRLTDHPEMTVTVYPEH